MEIKPSGASLPLALLAFSLTFTSQISLAQRQSSALDQQQQPQQPAIYQPALIGFRCESAHSTTSSGVSLVEANKPVRLTLFGQYFTTSTIVALTSELVQDPAAGQQPDDEYDDQSDNADDHVQRIVRQNKSSSSSTSTASNQPNGTAPSGQPAAAAHHRRQFAGRNRVLSSKYDCTDYNRITSYKLTSANILSPNVATITISLPELEPAAASGGAADSTRNYYFCLKQPPLPALEANQILRQQQQQQQLTSAGANATSNITSTSSLQMAPLSQAGQRHQEAQLVWVHQGDDWWLAIRAEPPILTIANDVFLILLLLFLSAVTSGLNLGLMSLDMNELAVISSCGDPRERSYARTIAPLRKRGNYLLCSLLLGNVLVNSTLTVVLEELTTGLIAVIGSTLAIVVLGEIVPQAFCARQGLAIGAKTIYLTYAFMILTFPLSYPISWLLDCVLGEEKGNVYDRERLMEFIRITGHHTQLESDEVAIISGALKLKKIKVDQIMTRIEDVFSLPINCMLDRDTIKRIIEKGYSRIPVYEFGDRKQIVALILAKDLALYDPDDKMPLAAMLKYCKHPLIFIDDSATLDVALNEFKTGKSHMAVVRQIYDDGEVDKYYEAIGVVTLEDVIEEVLQTEINDETDTLSDNRRKRRRANAQVPALEHWPVVESGASAAPPAPDQQAGELMASNLLMSQLVAADVGPRKQQAADEQNSGNSFNQTPASGANNLGGNQQLQLQLQLQQQQQRNLEQAPPSLLDESKETTANEQLARLP